jgi:predicted metalloprotease
MLLLSGTAHAALYPIKDPVLTKNKLYASGALKASKCPEKDIKRNDVPSAKRYLTALFNCLNASWGAHMKRAGLPFSKAKIGFITKPKRFCGDDWEDALGIYCNKERRYVMLLDKDTLADPWDLYLFSSVAHNYGRHLQEITGIDDAYMDHPYENDSEMDEQIRRSILQAECLGGVFMGSVWASLDRSNRDWQELRSIMRDTGDEGGEDGGYARGNNIVAWLDKGFKSKSPAACNTWTAPSSKVA